MNDFARLKRSAYHCVPYSPDAGRTTELVLSDIVLHLPVLEWFASRCQHVTEFGVRDGHSTVALAAGLGQTSFDGPDGPFNVLCSYDIETTGFCRTFARVPKPCVWRFTQADTGDPSLEIEPTDLLFIDTLHTYDHVAKELALHGRKAGKYLAFHDTFTCGQQDLSGPNPLERGIIPAIEEFLAKYPDEYRTAYRTDCNNGLWVLERIGVN